jgi:ferredoxin
MAKKIFISDNCIGCWACISICDEVFGLSDDWVAYVKEGVNIEDFPCVDDAKSACPVEAIQYK